MARRLLCLFTVAAALALASGAMAETLFIGGITGNIKKELKRHEPLAAYLTRELADAGVTAVEFKPVASSTELSAALAAGEVDIAFDSPLAAAKVARSAGARPFVRRWKDGVATYHSVIVVPAESEIETLTDLRGKRIGFQDPESTSGYMLPAGMFRREGIALRQLASHEEAVPADAVGYIFTEDDKNTMMWIYRGWIDAAATDPLRFGELDRAKPGAFRIIARIIEVPRQVGVHRADLDPALIAALTEALVAMDASAEGREALQMFNDTTRIDRFPKGADATFAPIFEVLDELVALGVI